VLGAFPTQSEDALLSLAWLEAAKYRDGGDEGDLHAGVDVAGPGEAETVLCVRRGSRIVLTKAWAGKDARGDVLAALMPFKGRLKTVNVDTVGIGFYMAMHLKDAGLPQREVNVGEGARHSEKYANLKAELYWGLRARAQAGDLAGLTDERTIAQLAGIRYSHNSRGQIVIESKSDAAKRGVKSPDRAEAVMRAFAELERGGGVVGFWLQQAAEQKAGRRTQNHPDRCPQCPNKFLSVYTDSWKCNACGASADSLTGNDQTVPPAA
jgi:hypothetical protein